MPAAEEYTDHTWIYVGRRVLAKGGLGDVWLTESGQQVTFKKMRGSMVGASYTITANADENSVQGTPRFQSGERHPNAPEWDLADRAAYNADQARLLEARLKKEVPLDDLTLRELRERLDRAMPATRTAMIAVVLQRLGA
jgi:hypothetical protein